MDLPNEQWRPLVKRERARAEKAERAAKKASAESKKQRKTLRAAPSVADPKAPRWMMRKPGVWTWHAYDVQQGGFVEESRGDAERAFPSSASMAAAAARACFSASNRCA